MMFQGVAQSEREERAPPCARGGRALKDFAQHYPGQLSGGMRQRAALARALSLETGILLMDEPFGALDEQTRMILGEDLSVLLARSGKTIVFVTHSLGEAVFPGRSRRGVLGTSRHHQGDHRGRRAASAQAGLRDLGRSSPGIRNQLYELLHDEIRKTMVAIGRADAAQVEPQAA